MPLILNRGQGSPDWRVLPSPCLRIGLVNNMPDAALEDTVEQFSSLLEEAAGDLLAYLRLYSLPEIVRGPQAQAYFRDFYCDFHELPNDSLDAVIITGTEPLEQDLRDEVYWESLVNLLDWAERETTSTIVSCLAAHASVLHGDGIERRRLTEKRLGVFDEAKVSEHALTTDLSHVVRIPHSRWNELPERALASCGYLFLTKSQPAGPGLFAKQKRRSLFIYSQGHPEYATHTLLKEYRRDVKRFLSGESDAYPSLPNDYFDRESTALLESFQKQSLTDPGPCLMSSFPYDAIAQRLENRWHASAVRLYKNWLHYIVSQKGEASKNRGYGLTNGEYARAGASVPLEAPHSTRFDRKDTGV